MSTLRSEDNELQSAYAESHTVRVNPNPMMFPVCRIGESRYDLVNQARAPKPDVFRRVSPLPVGPGALRALITSELLRRRALDINAGMPQISVHLPAIDAPPDS
jgi:hypothetical protein